jgi:hypothetical protein
MWLFSRRRRPVPAVRDQLDLLKVEREKLKLSVGRRIADENPEFAAALLLGNGRGAQAFAKEKTLAERFFEKKILSDDFEGLDKLERVRRLIREERDEMELESEPGPSGFERTIQTFLPVVAAVLNPTGFQAALAAASVQGQQQQSPLPQVPGPPSLQVAEVPASGASVPVGSMPAGISAGQQFFSPQPSDQSGAGVGVGENVYPFPIRAAVVLTNLEALEPDAFVRWALSQPALAGPIGNLAAVPDEELPGLLASAEANPLFGEFSEVFGWLRANPQKAVAIVQSLRMHATRLPIEEDVAI